ncbi:MAG: ATP-binding protein [Candidatus Omnitrophota bacterium]
MNYFSLSGLLVGTVSVWMSIFVFVRGRDSKTTLIWALYCLCVAVWGFGGFFIGQTHSEQTALLLWRATYVGVIFLPVIFFHFICSFLRLDRKIILTGAYGLSVLCVLADIFGGKLFIGRVEFMFGEFFWNRSPGVFHIFFFVVLFFGLIFYSSVLLLRGLTDSTSERRNQIKYFFAGAGLGWIGGELCFLPTFGIEIYPYSNFLVSLYPLIMGYSIVKHQLMDIEVVIRKTFIFSILFVSSLLVISCFVYAQSLFFEHSGLNAWLSLIPAVCIIVLIGRPFESFLKRVTDRYLFQKKYDYKMFLSTFSSEILSLIDEGELLKLSVKKLVDVIKVYSAGILLNDRLGEVLPWVFYDGKKYAERNVPESREIKILFEKHYKYIIVNENRVADGIPEVLSEAKSYLVIPLKCNDRPVGILALGAKKSDEDFTEDDIAILLPICKSLAIAIANAELIKKLTEANARAAQNEKMAVIGMLSAGINHEICNPLGIARGKCESFLSNARDGFYRCEEPEELIRKAEGILESVIRETDRAAVITKKLSSFASPPAEGIIENVDLSEQIENVLEFIRYDHDIGRIDITKNIAPGLPRVKAHSKEIQEILFNILRNGVEAIPEKGKITISVWNNADEVYIDITDTGVGISKAQIGRVFSPFFTTKAHNKGTGMGLFIIKQLIERNNGSIKVTSEAGRGTKVHMVLKRGAELQDNKSEF